MASGIYCIKNIINNKVYIGSAVDIKNRWYHHRWHLGRGDHHSTHLQSAWNKYGNPSFKFSLLEGISDINHLLIREQHWLDTYRSYIADFGYNCSPTAGSTLGKPCSDATKIKIGNKARLRYRTPKELSRLGKLGIGRKKSPAELALLKDNAYKCRFNKINLGVKYSEEHRRKISQGNLGRRSFWKGKTHTQEYKDIMSRACRGIRKSPMSKLKISITRKIVFLSKRFLKKVSNN